MSVIVGDETYVIHPNLYYLSSDVQGISTTEAQLQTIPLTKPIRDVKGTHLRGRIKVHIDKAVYKHRIQQIGGKTYTTLAKSSTG